MASVLHRPSEKEQKEAKLAHDTLEGAARYLEKEEGNHRVELSVDEAVKVTVPESALKFLLNYLLSLSEGKAVSILPVESEMSTQQAADILNVSRPHLVKLLEEGKIPFTKVGRHRRIRAEDVMEYKMKKSEKRRESLLRLTEEAQKLDVEY